jgi:hypothetical protein
VALFKWLIVKVQRQPARILQVTHLVRGKNRRGLAMKKILWGLAVIAGLGAAAQANAGPVLFDLAPESTVVLTSFDGKGGAPALIVNPNLASQSALLKAGETWTIDLFSIAFPQVGAASGTISAFLGFDSPAGAPDIQDSAKGSLFSFLVNFGELTWTSQPGQFSLSDGTKYSVVFENLSGATLARSVDVHAYLTLDTEPVPEPGTMALLALGVLGVMYVSRRQLLAQKA